VLVSHVGFLFRVSAGLQIGACSIANSGCVFLGLLHRGLHTIAVRTKAVSRSSADLLSVISSTFLVSESWRTEALKLSR